jgi:hypothetical protein
MYRVISRHVLVDRDAASVLVDERAEGRPCPPRRVKVRKNTWKSVRQYLSSTWPSVRTPSHLDQGFAAESP